MRVRMRVILFVLIGCAFNCHASPLASAENKLVAVVTLYRHGDRSPKESFPTDEFFDLKYWPMGFSQLTNIGKHRQFELGKWLRTRYDTFLSETYSPEDIYVRSTDKDRTLMSAYLNLAGLYSPKRDQIWNPDLLWQPIPVHTIPREIDDVITDKRSCKKYDKALKKAKKNYYFQDINKNHSTLYKYLSNHSGWKVEDINKVKKIQATFQSYESYNKSFIPEWTKSIDNDEMDYLSGLAYQRYTYTEEMKRLRNGPFFDHLFKYFDGVINGDKDTHKFYMISAHETTVAPILSCMSVYDLKPIDFAATIIWELRKTADAYFVNLFYKTDSGLKELAITGCEEDCLYEDFKKAMEPITVDLKSWIDECDN